MTNGAVHCEFVYRGTGLTEPVTPSKNPVMRWEYHCGHLAKTMGEVLADSLGGLGLEAIEEALTAFTQQFGVSASEIVRSYSGSDFGRLPE